VGRGPGAFTGVRLAIALAQGVAMALDRPVVPVSTLAALTLQASRSDDRGVGRVLAAIDARMGEVYAGTYALRDGDAVAMAAEAVARPESVEIADAGWRGVGTGFAAADGALQRRLAHRLAQVDAAALPHAADVARLAAQAWTRGEALAPERVEPAYLRNNVALTLAEQQALRAAR